MARYFSLDQVELGDSTQVMVALWLTSLSTAMWIFVFAVMLLEDHSGGAKSLAVACAFRIHQSASLWRRRCMLPVEQKARSKKPVSLRTAIALSSGCLRLIRLFL
jgi:hypothetical protein